MAASRFEQLAKKLVTRTGRRVMVPALISSVLILIEEGLPEFRVLRPAVAPEFVIYPDMTLDCRADR